MKFSFEKDEQFFIPPRTCQVIYARVLNPEIDVGHVELQNLGKGLLFGNFIGENRERKVYAVILNTMTEEARISPPEVTSHLCGTAVETGDLIMHFKLCVKCYAKNLF